MLNRVSAVLALLLAGWTVHSALAATKKPKAINPKAPAKASKKKAAPKSTSKTATRSKTQAAPTPERYKEIQQALASKGYLTPDQATGQWDSASADALKHFQADQKIDSTGKINSLSLIALGLGPKHDTSQTGAGASTAEANPLLP
jgi:N-acetyl-anhydromuramyl-L-alanine amidase AmpD